MEHDWSFEAVRVCRACRGSGKASQRPPIAVGPGAVTVTAPFVCATCAGTKEERKRFSVAELKDLIAL
jgi:hypothetical protein